jgi:predicted NBD/HSP70 family sugar kinase
LTERILKIPALKYTPPLDPDFQPAVLFNHVFQREAKASGKPERLVLGLERLSGNLSRYETTLLPTDHPSVCQNFFYAERLLKTLIWQFGGWRVYVGGPREVADYIRKVYAADGLRAFDRHFMGELVYEKPFEVVECLPDEVPPAREARYEIGRHLEGNRIGFDLGASDIKVSAVIDGQAVFSKEIIWEPVKQNDPAYHRGYILQALKEAAAYLPSLDAIGGSSAGICIDNRIMVASLFRNVPRQRFSEVKKLFSEIQDVFKVPVQVVNDGEVTALAGSMSLEENGILGIALGSSEAGGYITREGKITDWMNELAFIPVDFNPEAPIEDWSGDRGVGASYFSQQCVFRLASAAGISIPMNLSNAEKLKFVQERLESGHEGVCRIWESIGVYLGYAIAHYADFYDLDHVLILGRVTSSTGGLLILENANRVLQSEFPDLFSRIKIQLPDEKSRRVGQSIAAASLPEKK